ncbi:MAG: 50S ribosomal protein L10 [Acidimicrobiia bacterium]|nr:50S ribosomal protein L10 [Acidimicrobiia bacterium]
MPRPEKVQAVAEIKERLEGARAVFLAEYAGLSVKDQQKLRRELRAKGAEFKVVKMTLARRAAAELEIDALDELLLGPTGLTFSDEDAVTTAKVLKDFAKDHEVFVVKGGLLGSEFITPEKISELAEIEPRDVLLAKIAGAMKAPMANLAGLVVALPRNTASVLQQLLDKKAAEAPVDEAPADETPDADKATEEEAPIADAAEETTEASDDDETDEPVEAPEASADADDADETEDDSADVEASTDADEDTEETTEASDDAEEE